jgi:phosphatidylglycerol---prolipoprotein diacylglyceryl transferase
MHRVLISHPHIGSYSACLFVAFLAGYLLLRWRAVRLGIPGRHIDNISLLIPPISLFGARFFSWLFYQPDGTGFVEGMMMEGGGLVFYGGVTFAALTVIIYTLVRRLSVPGMADACAPSVLLGLAIGRIGCFLAGCCWGDLCVDPKTMSALPDPHLSFKVQTFPAVSHQNFPLSVQFPAHSGAHEQHVRLKLISPESPRSLPVHPVQLYEAVLALVLAVSLHLNFHRRRNPGDVLWMMMLGYGLIRFAVEFFRADNSPAYWGLTISQAISVLFVIAGGLGLVWRLQPAPRPQVAINPLP